MNDALIVKQELDKIGLKIDDIYDLVNSDKTYHEAIPVLLDLLKRVEHDGVKEGIIRALAVNEAKGKADSLLIDEFFRVPKEKLLLRWVIGNTMEVVISNNVLDKVIKIINDKSNGMSRQMFVLALGNLSSPKCEDALIEVLNDEEVAPQALEALGKLKSQKAINKINNLTKHKNSLIRKEAKKALKEII
jgi:hypothetical protein